MPTAHKSKVTNIFFINCKVNKKPLNAKSRPRKSSGLQTLRRLAHPFPLRHARLDRASPCRALLNTPSYLIGLTKSCCLVVIEHAAKQHFAPFLLFASTQKNHQTAVMH
jgi:hypothetical protein